MVDTHRLIFSNFELTPEFCFRSRPTGRDPRERDVSRLLSTAELEAYYKGYNPVLIKTSIVWMNFIQNCYLILLKKIYSRQIGGPQVDPVSDHYLDLFNVVHLGTPHQTGTPYTCSNLFPCTSPCRGPQPRYRLESEQL